MQNAKRPALLSILALFAFDASAAIGEAQYRRSLAKVTRIMEPQVRKHGLELAWNTDWKNDEFVAQVEQPDPAYPNRRTVSLSGGMGRSKFMNVDSFELIACHELGHVIGGAPKFWFSGEWKWLEAFSLEGESDYFATLQCAKLIWRNDDNVAIIRDLDTSDEASRQCRQVYSNAQDAALCIRSVHAGVVNMLVIMDEYRSDDWGPVPDLNKYDPAKVEWTYQLHPKAQCRVDTYVAGALCDRDPRKILSDTDWNLGKCARGLGARPRCWFANGKIREESPSLARKLLRKGRGRRPAVQ